MSRSGSSGEMRQASSKPFSAALLESVFVVFPTQSRRLNGTDSSSSLPASIFDPRVDSTFDNFLIFRFDDPRSHLGRALPLEGISGPGDSGGPALLPTPHGLRVAGISSAQRDYGASEGTYNVDEYYVRISAVREWIDSVIGERS